MYFATYTHHPLLSLVVLCNCYTVCVVNGALYLVFVEYIQEILYQ